jgi:uncharacterized phiE125 gp8 family phage protein
MTMTTGRPGRTRLGEGDRAAAAAQARALVRNMSGQEDALLSEMIDEAFALAEQFTARVLIARTMTEGVTADGTWRRLAATPVLGVTGVASPSGEALPVEQYAIDIDAAGDGWVRVSGGGRAVVTLTAGMAEDWDSLPPGIAGGVVRLAAHRFTARDDAGAPPASVAALWRPWRRMRLHDQRVPA